MNAYRTGTLWLLHLAKSEPCLGRILPFEVWVQLVRHDLVTLMSRIWIRSTNRYKRWDRVRESHSISPHRELAHNCGRLARRVKMLQLLQWRVLPAKLTCISPKTSLDWQVENAWKDSEIVCYRQVLAFFHLVDHQSCCLPSLKNNSTDGIGIEKDAPSIWATIKLLTELQSKQMIGSLLRLGAYPEDPVVIECPWHHGRSKRASRIDGATINGNEHQVIYKYNLQRERLSN